MAWLWGPDVNSSVQLPTPTACTWDERMGGSDAADPFLFETASGDKGFSPAITTTVSAYDFFHS